MLISDTYRALNAQLHAADPDYGTSGSRYAELVKAVADKLATRSILDYGCGKRTLEAGLGFAIANYDPAVPGLDARPKPADLVACTDVLEHIEPEHIDQVLADLAKLTKRVAFLAIACGPARRTLADGRNAHVIQQPLEWWLPKLRVAFRTLRYWGTPRGFIFIGQSYGDPTSGLDLGAIGPPAATTTVTCKSAYTDEQRCANVRSAMLRGLPSVRVLPKHDNTMVLACYGPSLIDTVEELRAEVARDGHDLYTVSGAHPLLIGHGIIPKGHIESDPRPHKAKCLGTPDARVVYFLSSACDRAMFNQVHGHETFVHHVTSSNAETDLIAAMDQTGVAFTIDGGTNVGMSAIGLGTVLGYRRFSIYGMDCSFRVAEGLLNWPNDQDLPENIREQVLCHAGAHPNEDQPLYRVWVDGRPFVSSPQMFQGAQDFAVVATGSKDCTFTLHGDGFLRALMAHIAADKQRRKRSAHEHERPSRAA
jgi:hypothetical protein